jgi:hypothetical protein
MPFVDRIDKACCSMRVFLVGHDSWAGTEPPPEPGVELEKIDGPASLSEALIALEERLGSAGEAAVVLGDDSELSLAAALVAVKLPLLVAATASAADPGTTNGRLLAQLAEATLADGLPDVVAWARPAG